MNVIDKIVNFISPRAGHKRMKYRSYDAASYGRRTKSFERARSSGPNLEISQALITLRNRSRLFTRNNAWAKRAIQCIANNTVGEGIRPAPNGTPNQVKKIKSIWKDWAESTACDWYGKNTFYGLQKLAMKEIAESGEMLILKRRVAVTPDNPIPIKLQLIEADQLDQSRDFEMFNEDGGYSRLGVRYDKDGRLMGYWLFDIHPTDGTGFFKQVFSTYHPKEDVIHAYEILRIGQVRGVPMGIASFIKLSDFSEYEDAQLMRQKVAACFSAFVVGDDDVLTGGDRSTDRLDRLEPGIIQYLRNGEQVTFGNPPPAEQYDSYTTKILQGIAASYGITYEMLTMDYSKVNFSSGKMAQINVVANFREWQYNMMVPQICVPVWNWFMEGVLVAGLMSQKLTCSCTDWTAPRVAQLDPMKETSARILAIQGGLTTVSECLREDGRDPDEFFDEYKRDKDRLDKMGITLSSIMLPSSY